jgi:hypothetical protein
MGVYWGT